MFAFFSLISCPTTPLCSPSASPHLLDLLGVHALASPLDRERTSRPGRHHRIKDSSARKFKEQSSQFVRMGRKHHAEAVSSYTKAIAQLEPLSSLDAADASVLFANRAHVNLLLGNHRRSLDDAELAIRLSPSSVKVRELIS